MLNKIHYLFLIQKSQRQLWVRLNKKFRFWHNFTLQKNLHIIVEIFKTIFRKLNMSTLSCPSTCALNKAFPTAWKSALSMNQISIIIINCLLETKKFKTRKKKEKHHIYCLVKPLIIKWANFSYNRSFI